jgi:conjugative relaxase-like TrwC/TraI family protein
MAWFRMMGVESVAYHRSTVLERGDDFAGRALQYYGSRGETPLVWGGRVAERLGLSGAVSDAEYSAVFAEGGATDPVLGTRLASVTRPGVELVVSAHKSVAVLGVIGRADDMHAILDAETTATLEFVEAWFERQGGRRGRAQTRTRTGGLLWAQTRHATSRAGDPTPHDHVLVANVTEMLDARGGWKGLDTAALRDVVHAATMAGRVASAAKAVELGYAITPDAGPSGRLDHWQIDGIPDAVLEAFSKRSADIDAAVEAGGVNSPSARTVAARATRSAKRAEDPESLMARWVGELEEVGWPVRRLQQRLDHVSRTRHRPLEALYGFDRDAMAFELLSPEGPLAQVKSFTRSDVVRAVAPRLYGHRPGELDAVVAAVLKHADAIPLVGQPGARSRAWVAATVIATEGAVADVAARLAATAGPAARSTTVREAAAAKERTMGRPLTGGQRAAVEAVATSGRSLDVVVGVAGSGKTTALDVVRAAFEADGYRVLGIATSGQAARSLGTGAGVESRTIASFVWRLEHGTLRLDNKTVLLVDEAGMTSDTDMLKLLVAAEATGAKVVAIGDHHQLGAVAPGGGLEALTERHPDAVHLLADNIRQADPAERRALEQLRHGRVADAVAWYRDADRLVTRRDRVDSLDAAVAAWAADVAAGRDTVLLAWRRRDVAALNARARQHLVDAGRITGPELEAPGGRRYAAGDLVVALAPGEQGRYVTSQRGTVLSVREGAAIVRFDDGGVVTLAGDELSAERLDHAYALTVHRVQGATVDTAHVYANGGGRELAYVALSRARTTTHIYATADTSTQAAADLENEWSTSTRPRWTLDTDSPASSSTTQQPQLATRIDSTLRIARLATERAALVALTGGDEQPKRIEALDSRIELERLMTPPSRPAPSRGRGLGL